MVICVIAFRFTARTAEIFRQNTDNILVHVGGNVKLSLAKSVKLACGLGSLLCRLFSPTSETILRTIKSVRYPALFTSEVAT